MKKLIIALLAVLLIVMAAAPASFAAERGKVLVVHGGADAVGEGDKAIGDKIASMPGFTQVDYIHAPKTDENSWKGYSLVFIGESVSSADVNTKFTKAECYIICSEPGLWDELLFGAYDSAYDSDSFNGTYKAKNDILKTGITSFKGFTKDETPGFLKEWSDGVTVIFENEKGAPAVTLVEKGGKLIDGSASTGPRSTFFNRGQSAANFTDESWKIFTALIDYVLPLPVETTTAAAKAAVAAKPAAAAQTFDAGIALWIMAAGAALSAGAIGLKRR